MIILNLIALINLKKLLVEKNPLFQGVQANDSKDLINFLLEEMNNELKNFKNTNTDDNNSINTVKILETIFSRFL